MSLVESLLNKYLAEYEALGEEEREEKVAEVNIVHNTRNVGAEEDYFNSINLLKQGHKTRP